MGTRWWLGFLIVDIGKLWLEYFSSSRRFGCRSHSSKPGYHILGTDKTGQDVLYLALKSVRTGLIIGTLTTLIVTPFAILCGILAGYVGGWIDDYPVCLFHTRFDS